MRHISVILPLLFLLACGSEGKRVRISLPLPPKLDLTDYNYLYFPGFVTTVENEIFDTEREAINFLRRELSRKDVMSIVDRPPVDLSELDPRSFFQRTQPFFQSFNFQNSEATLALTGEIAFDIVDRSGFREVQRTDFTGRRIRQTQFVEITGFDLSMRVFVYEIGGGRLLYSQLLKDTMDVEGSNPDHQLVFYDLMQRVSNRIIGLFSNTLVRAERSLL